MQKKKENVFKAHLFCLLIWTISGYRNLSTGWVIIDTIAILYFTAMVYLNFKHK